MHKIIRWIALIGCFWFSITHAKILKTDSTAVIAAELKQADRHALVVFDVDGVLIVPSDVILQPQNKAALSKLNESLLNAVGKGGADGYISTILMQRTTQPVDAELVQVIARLQAKNINVLALTNCFTGKFGHIPLMQAWRNAELRQHGYCFDVAWKGVAPTVFYGLPIEGDGLSAKQGVLPAYENGIVFTSAASKGDVLRAFLQYAHVSPRKIICIDDKRSHLESVSKMAAGLGIEFEGVEYTAVKTRYREAANADRAALQFKVLNAEKRWVSDVEADVRRARDAGE